MAEPNSVNSLFSSKINIQISISLWTEKNEKLPFLDVLVSKKADDTLGHQVYRKPTHIDRYMSSHTTQKQSAINSHVHRAFIISDKEHLQTEHNHLKSLTEKRTWQKKHNQNNQQTCKQDNGLWHTIRREDPIHSPICQRNNRLDWQDVKHNIQTIFKPPKKIGILRNPKDQRPPFSSAGLYKISCS